MIKQNVFQKSISFKTILLASVLFFSCDDTEDGGTQLSNDTAVFLVLDEESIDNGNEPNNFSEVDVNDQLAAIGLRTPLKWFKENAGREIQLYTGEVGDEGWFAVKTIPDSWKSAGPGSNGLSNYLAPGPGLGSGDDDREVLLDQVADVTPLRARGISMLKGKTVFALVYDGDVSINYSPLNGNLMGSNLGIVAFDVLDVKQRMDGSDSSLPVVTIRIQDSNEVKKFPMALFSNAPIPQSSGEPFDVVPVDDTNEIRLTPAN